MAAKASDARTRGVREIPERVTASRPCVVCGRPDWCCYWSDGTALCARVWSDRPAGSAGWVHKTNAGAAVATRTAEQEAADRAKIARHVRLAASALTAGDVDRIAASLKVPVPAVRAMAGVFVGDDGGGPFDGYAMSSPDDGGGWGVCGYSRRYGDGSKKTIGRAGLFFPGLMPPGDVLFVVEGYSDVMAMYAAGLPAVGRPSNIAGAELVTRFVAERVAGDWRAVVVVAENDEHPDGLWPGMTGAVAVADRVRAGLKAVKAGRPVYVRRVPEAAKDPRAWFQLSGYSKAACDTLRKVLTAGV